MKNYIIYEITNKINNKKYIGCHVTENIFDDYMGSGKYLKNAINKYGVDNFEKVILHFCKSKEDMLKKEKELVNEDVVNSKEYYNLTLGGSGGWYYINNNLDKYRPIFQNKIVVNDVDGNILKVSKDDERYINGELISIQKNRIICKDKDGNIFNVFNTDERYINGELISIHKGLVLVKDNIDKVMLVSKDDERYINGELISFWVNRKHSDETKIKIGQANSISQKGEKNSQFGKCWIICENEKKCIKINKKDLNDYLLNGWKKGRKMNW
jgi:hypothetical protein